MPKGIYPRTELSKNHKGKSHSLETKVKMSKIKLGKKHSLKTKQKISATMKENKIGVGQNNPMFGKNASLDTRIKMSLKHSKENHWNWQGGISFKQEVERRGLNYSIWRIKVFKRDNYTCVKCKTRGGLLEADHIIPWSISPSLRLDVNNGQTLCLRCHRIKSRFDYQVIKYFKIKKLNSQCLSIVATG